MDLLRINKMPTSKDDVEVRELMKEKIVPSIHEIALLSGSAGSGKTSLLYNMLTNPLIYGPSYELMTEDEKKDGMKGYWDAIFLFLGSCDDAYNLLIKRKIILPHHVCLDPKPEDIQRIIDEQLHIIEESNGKLGKVPKILIILDDVIANSKFMRSKPVIYIMTYGRHINSSTILCTQYLNLVPKSIRQQASYTMIFKCNRAEASILTDQYCPPLVTIKDFNKLIEQCTKDDENNHNNFMVISKKSPLDKRFRRNLTQYIVPPNTLKQPRLRSVKNKAVYEDEEDEEIQRLLNEPLERVPFEVSSNNGYKERHSSIPEMYDTLHTSKKSFLSDDKKDKMNIPHVQGFINPTIYKMGGKINYKSTQFL
jgi:hypothetical protein